MILKPWVLLIPDVCWSGFDGFHADGPHTVGFIHVVKKLITWWQISRSCDKWISAIREVASQWGRFTSLLSNCTFSGMIHIWFKKILWQRWVWEMQIHWMDTICLKLGTFEGFATALFQTVIIRGKRFWHHVITLNHLWIKPTLCSWKKPFQQMSGYHCCCYLLLLFFNLQVRHYIFVLEPKPFNLTKPRPRSVPMPEKVSLRFCHKY